MEIIKVLKSKSNIVYVTDDPEDDNRLSKNKVYVIKISSVTSGYKVYLAPDYFRFIPDTEVEYTETRVVEWDGKH